ncbi:GumC family protein [Pikeienuella sp. HZG-20]|uniref:GumC family protein n=1 Tax=Paludibacillus litoralis TaxID=3133267 RepID=UPI0030EECDE0
MNTPGNIWNRPTAPRERDHGRSGAVEDDDSLFGLARGLVATLWRWRLLILAIVAAGVSAAWLVLQTIPSTYIASAEVYFDFSRQSVVSDLPAAAVAPSEATLNTEMKIVTSRNLMNVVVDELNLLEDPEFNPWLTEPGDPETSAETPPSEEQIRIAAVSTLLGQVNVSLVSNSYVFSVTVETLGPEKSAAIANGIADLFIQERTGRRLTASEDAVSWLERRTLNLRERVREAENRVSQQRALVSPGADSSLNSMAVKIAFLRERLATSQAEARRLADLEERLGAASGRTALDAETSSALRKFSGDLAREIDAAAETDIGRLGALVERARSEVATAAEEVRSEVVRAETELEGLLAAYSDQTDEVQALRDSEREAAASLAAYEAMLERLKRQVAVDAVDPFWPEATVISPAVPPAFPASPQRKLILAVAGVGSLALASGLALLLNALFPVVSSARELERVTGIPVLARIPLPLRRRLPRLQRQLRRRGASPLADGLRTLRIAIALESRDSAPRVLLLTSAEKGEDKSATGYLLAQSFLQAGRKVLLIDADPSARAFGRVPTGPGLNSVLIGKTDLRESITKDKNSGLDILFASKALSDDADLIAYDRNRAGLEKIASEYDVVIVIAPPVGTLPDARILARLSDAVLVVVRRNASRPAAVAEALELLVSGGASRVATVLLSRRRR